MRKLLIILAAAFAFSPLAQASSITISPQSFGMPGDVVQPIEGDTIVFDLDVNLTELSGGGRFFIEWDPSVLQFDSFTFSDPSPWGFVERAIPGAGSIDVQLVTGFDAGSLVIGDIDIGDFALVALAPVSATMIDFSVDGIISTSQWNDGSGNTIQMDYLGSSGSIAPIPIPAVAYMFPAGLIAGLGWMRRRERSTTE